MGDEYNSFLGDMASEDVSRITSVSGSLLLLGCIVGTGIGYTGWWCRDKVSATSFTLIGVINKCLTVLLNLCFCVLSVVLSTNRLRFEKIT